MEGDSLTSWRTERRDSQPAGLPRRGERREVARSNPAPTDASRRVSKVPPGSFQDRGMCGEPERSGDRLPAGQPKADQKRTDDRPAEGGALNSGGPISLPPGNRRDIGSQPEVPGAAAEPPRDKFMADRHWICRVRWCWLEGWVGQPARHPAVRSDIRMSRGRGLQTIICAELLIPECRSVPWLVHARSPPEPFCQSQGKKLNVGGAIKPIWANRNLVIENNRESATRIVPPFVKVVPRNP